MNFKIKTITAIIGLDPATGDEGIWGTQVPNGTMMPMVMADETRLRIMLPLAEEISKRSGVHYRVVQFSAQQDITEAIKAKFL